MTTGVEAIPAEPYCFVQSRRRNAHNATLSHAAGAIVPVPMSNVCSHGAHARLGQHSQRLHRSAAPTGSTQPTPKRASSAAAPPPPKSPLNAPALWLHPAPPHPQQKQHPGPGSCAHLGLVARLATAAVEYYKGRDFPQGDPRLEVGADCSIPAAWLDRQCLPGQAFVMQGHFDLGQREGGSSRERIGHHTRVIKTGRLVGEEIDSLFMMQCAVRNLRAQGNALLNLL